MVEDEGSVRPFLRNRSTTGPSAASDGRPDLARHRAMVVTGLAALLLLQMGLAMRGSSNTESTTFDEPAHIGAAVGYMYEHDLSWNVEHPPLVKVLAGLPLRLADLNVPRDTVEYRAGMLDGWGQQILFQRGNDTRATVALARLPLIILTCLFGLVVFGFATDLFGAPGGLIALAAFGFCPDVLAHGPLVTTDVAVSGFMALTLWMLWRARYRDRRWLVAAGFAFGLACVSKFTALVYAPAVLPLFVLAGMPRRSGGVPLRRRLLGATARAAGAGLVALAVVWATYLAIDPHLRYRLPMPRVAAQATGPLAVVADHLPAPKPYRIGVRFVLGGEKIDRSAFLRGTIYNGGRLSFYPLVLSMKTPVALMALWTAAVALLFARRRRDVLLFVLLPAAFIFASAMFSALNLGVRHVMPTVFLLLISTGALATARVRAVRAAAIATAGLVGVVSWSAYPRYFSYINELWGGPSNGYKLVADSNFDWGQSLPALATYLRKGGIDTPEEVQLVYFGQAAPNSYGINATDAREIQDFTDVRGTIVVSATHYSFQPARFAVLGRPDAIVGDTFFVFDRR